MLLTTIASAFDAQPLDEPGTVQDRPGWSLCDGRDAAPRTAEHPERDRLEAALARDAARLGRLVDGDALARVLRNLLDNAIAAVTSSGSIRIDEARNNGQVEARVTDNGPGVPQRERERIFERFVRLDQSTPGSGLGLAIARRIARHHHGDVTCDASDSGGRFTLRLPTPHANPRC